MRTHIMYASLLFIGLIMIAVGIIAAMTTNRTKFECHEGVVHFKESGMDYWQKTVNYCVKELK